MPEWGDFLFWPTYLYLAAVAMGLAVLPARAVASRIAPGSPPRLAVWLPPLAVLCLPILTALFPHADPTEGALHRLWHEWEERVHGSPSLHGVLHAVNLALVVLMGASLLRAVSAASSERAFAAGLAACGIRAADHPDLPLYRLPSSRPLCFTTGWLRPRIYLSAGLESRLEPGELKAVLAHERRHVERRDGILGGMLHLFYVLFPVPGSRLLLADWRAGAEMECDAAAARSVGSPRAVARALIRVAELARQPSPAGTIAFAEDDVEARIAALMAPARTGVRQAGAWTAGAGALLPIAQPFLLHLARLLVHH